MDVKTEFIDSLRLALTGFGLNEAETVVYGAVLRLGSRQASRIAKATGLNRAYTYDILASLTKKGLMQETLRNRIKHYSCTPPEQLVQLLKQQEKEVALKRQRLEEVLPRLNELQLRGRVSGEYLRTYQDSSFQAELLDRIAADACGTIRAVVSGEGLSKTVLDEFIDTLHQRNSLQTLKFIVTNANSVQNIPERRYAAFPLESTDIILSNETIYVFSTEPSPACIVVSQQSLHFTAVQIFESIWATCARPKS